MSSIFQQTKDLFKNLQSKATPIVNNITNFRTAPNRPTLGQAAQNAWKNNLFQQMANAPKTPVGNVVRPFGQAAGGVFSGLSFGTVNPVTAKPQNRIEQGANIGGNVMGMFSPVGFGAKVLAPIGLKTEAAIAGRLIPKAGSSVARKIISKAVPILAGEIAQTGAVAGLRGIANQQFNPTEDLAYGVGARGVLGGASKILTALKGYSPRSFDIHPDDQRIMKDFVNRVQSGGAQMNLGKHGVDVQRIAEHYIGDKARTLSGAQLAKVFDALLSNAAIRRGEDAIQTPFPKMGLVGEEKVTKINTTQDYLKELTQKQQQASSVGKVGIKQKVGNFLADIKAKMVDETSPITDILTEAEKRNKFKTLPTQDIRLQIDRVLRSKTLASQFAEDNGIVDVIKRAPDLNALDQYMIAKQVAMVEKQGIKTGRDLVRDQQLITDLSPQYEAFAQQVNQYSRKLLDYSVKTGLIDEKLAKELVIKYPEYVPLQRIFNELEQPTVRGTGRGVASIASQSVVKKLKGSEREIASPIESILLKTQDAFSQGERNIAAKQLASYKDLPGFEGLIKEVDSSSKAPHTFSFIDKGVKKTFATTREIEAAAKSLNVEQMGLLGKILSVPTRMLQLGATGLNVPFVITNVLKDEITGFVNSNRAAKTSLLNPSNYLRSIYSAVKHDEFYKEVVRNAGGGTSFDIAREAPNLAVEKIRSPIKYTVKHPLELLRVIENIVGRSEELGRIKNFQGTKQALLKEGRTAQDALLLAGQAGRENTANFARRGSFGRVINWVIPFFNAGIQGSRQLVRSFQNSPAQTSAKVAATIFTPIAVTTAWNLSDPQRKQIYDDIPQYEKENNLILIPPDATQDAKGRWNVIKIPLPPGLSNLGTIVRRSLETAQGLNPVTFGEIATNLITAGTSIDVTSGNKLASTFTPQIAKPAVEATTNTNLFTGQKIVPEYLKNQPPEFQTKPGTSPIAEGIGKTLNVSPLLIENFAQTQLGGLGSQLLGKESVAGNIQRRFSKASGGNLLDKVYEDSTKVQAINNQAKNLFEAGRKDEAINLIRNNKEILLKAKKAKLIRSEVDKYQEFKNKVKADTRLTQEQKNKVLILIQKKLNGLSNIYAQ